MSQTTRIIEIIIGPSGQTTVQTRGFAGSSCRDATKQLEAALGMVESDKPTAELHGSATSQEPARQTIGG